MGVDEEGTHAAVQYCLGEVFNPKIDEHHGRVVKTTGDGLLVEYPSVLNAVRCAVEIQTDLADYNSDRPANKRLLFRIGVNLGDIILDQDDIFGDGVNVAARLEGIADPGGVAISGAVYDQVHNKLNFGFEDLGERSMKNIAQPVRVYRVTPDPISDRSAGKSALSRVFPNRRAKQAAIALAAILLLPVGWWLFTSGTALLEHSESRARRDALPLPTKPSIAVLPFNDFSGEAGKSYLADGLTENIIAALAKISKMFVVARHSVFTYQGKAVKVQRVGKELGVRYVLEGSIQRSGDRLRITVQLIDARSGYHLWSERYDRGADQIFNVQDEITLNVVAALQIKLTEGEMARVRRRGTESLEALLLVTQSIELFQKLNKEDNARARVLAEKAIAVDPNYTDAYVRLARTHITDFQAGWVSNRAAAFKRSLALAKKALELDDSYADTYNLLGAIYLFVNQQDQALLLAKKAVALSPNYAIAKASLGMVETYAGMPEKAIETIKSAMRLSPYYPDWFLKELGRAYFQLERYEDAIKVLEEGLKRNSNNPEARILLAASLASARRHEEARTTVSAFLKSRPGYTVKQYARGEYYKNPAHLKRVLDALQKAGLPK